MIAVKPVTDAETKINKLCHDRFRRSNIDNPEKNNKYPELGWFIVTLASCGRVRLCLYAIHIPTLVYICIIIIIISIQRSTRLEVPPDFPKNVHFLCSRFLLKVC